MKDSPTCWVYIHKLNDDTVLPVDHSEGELTQSTVTLTYHSKGDCWNDHMCQLVKLCTVQCLRESN